MRSNENLGKVEIISSARREYPTRKSRFHQSLFVGLILGALAIIAQGVNIYDQSQNRMDSERIIDQACAGIADPDTVLALHGGVTRLNAVEKMSLAEPSSGKTGRASEPPGACELFQSEGTSNASQRPRKHFRLQVTSEPDGVAKNAVNGWADGPFLIRNAARGRNTSELSQPIPQPINDGRSGYYTEKAVTIRTICSSTSGSGQSLRVEASVPYDHVSDTDRGRMAGIAVHAARVTAKNLGCRTRVDTPPQRLPHPSSRFSLIEDAKGTCSWYRRLLRSQNSVKFPNLALETESADSAWQESCMLGASRTRVSVARSQQGAMDHHPSNHVALNPVPSWWMQFQTFFRDDANDVFVSGAVEKESPIRSGTAGIHRGRNIWWASSICRGHRALHIMTFGDPYREIPAAHLRLMLHAYSEDVADRRDCVKVSLPPESVLDGGR